MLIRYYHSAESNKGEDRIQLFHLKEDPLELCKVADLPGNQEQIARLATRLADWQR